MGIVFTLKRLQRRKIPSIYKKAASGGAAFGMGCQYLVQNFTAADVAEEYGTYVNGFYSEILIISGVLAAVIIVSCLLGIVTSKQTKKVETYMTWIKCVVLAYLALLLVPALWSFATEFLKKALHATGGTNILGLNTEPGAIKSGLSD